MYTYPDPATIDRAYEEARALRAAYLRSLFKTLFTGKWRELQTGFGQQAAA